MAATHESSLHPPREAGMMGANMIVPLHAVVERYFGEASRDWLFSQVGLEDLPAEDGTVPEGQVAMLHRLVRETWPEDAPKLLDMAGRVAAEVFVAHRVPTKARLLLQNMPWSVSAWLVGKSARFHSWSFAGSGIFAIQTTSRLAIFNNPLTAGMHSDTPICDFHSAMFEHMFQRLSHRDFTCTETTCGAMGGDHCTFDLKI